jgi:hypothetical protein
MTLIQLWIIVALAVAVAAVLTLRAMDGLGLMSRGVS